MCCASAPSGSPPSPCPDGAQAVADGGRAAGGPSGSRARCREWRAPFGAMSAANWIGMNANQYLHRYGAPREMLGLIALNGRAQRGLNPEAIYRDPMTMDDYLSARPDHLPLRALRLRRAVRRLHRGDRLGRRGRRRPAPPGGAHRGHRHPDPGAGVLGPGHADPRAAGASARPRTCGPGPTCGPPTSTWRWSTTASPSTPSRGSRASGSAGSARPTTGSTVAAASPSTASSRSTRTAGSSRRAGATGSGSSTRRSPSCATTPATRQVAGATTAVVTSGGGTPSGVLLLQRKDA